MNLILNHNHLYIFFKASRLCDSILADLKSKDNDEINWPKVSKNVGMDIIKAKILWKYLAYGEIWDSNDFNKDYNSDQVFFFFKQYFTKQSTISK